MVDDSTTPLIGLGDDDVFGTRKSVQDKPRIVMPSIIIIYKISVAESFDNILILIAEASHENLRNNESIFIVNLASSDMYATAIANPSNIVNVADFTNDAMEQMQKKIWKSSKVMQTVNKNVLTYKKKRAVDSFNDKEEVVMRKTERIRRQVERLNKELLLLQQDPTLFENEYLKYTGMKLMKIWTRLQTLCEELALCQNDLKRCLNDDDRMKQMRLKMIEKCLRALWLARDTLLSEKGYCFGDAPKTMNLTELVQKASEDSMITAIQQLKDMNNWTPSTLEASQALILAFVSERNNICQLLITEGVTLDMSDLPEIVHEAQEEAVLKGIQHLKNISRWEPGDVWCSEAFIRACENMRYSTCDLLIQEGVILDMFVFREIVENAPETLLVSLLQYLKDTNKWISHSEEASKALQLAFINDKKNICQSIIKQGVELHQRHITHIIKTASGTLIYKLIQQLKEKNRWNHLCWDTVKTLLWAFENEKADTCEILIQEGVQLEMCLLDDLSTRASTNVIIKAIEHLKDQNQWNPQSYAASIVLEKACSNAEHCLYEFLIQEGVKVKLSYLPDIVKKAPMSVVIRIAGYLKNINQLYYTSEILKWAFIFERMDICNQLIQVGIVIKMCQFLEVVEKAPQNVIMKVIEYLKGTSRWNPHLQTAADALRQAIACEKNKICTLLIHEGIILEMHDFYKLVREAPIKPILKVVQHLKENMRWRSDVLALDALNLFKDHRGLGIYEMLQREGIQSSTLNHEYERNTLKANRMTENILFLTNIKSITCQHVDAGEIYEVSRQMHTGFTRKEKEVLSIIASHDSLHHENEEKYHQGKRQRSLTNHIKVTFHR